MSAEMTVQQLQERLEQGEALRLIDVREDEEWEEGHIRQARHLALSRLQDSIGELSDDEGQLVIICRSGGRSGKACAYLEALGYDVVNVQGGMMAWEGDVVQGR